MKYSPDNVSCTCHACGHHAAECIIGFESLQTVTSDCKPFKYNTSLCACPACGTVQKRVDKSWQIHAEAIYKAYEIYHQGQGREQMVFESESGRASPRSLPVFDSVNAILGLPDTGRLLDLGCGNGSFLNVFSRARPQWVLSGLENSDKYKKEVEAITGVERLSCSGLDDMPGPFELITLIHVLEHIPDPVGFLRQLRVKLTDDGHIAVHVPNFLQNPFDLLIFDHCTHFVPQTLANTAHAAGYEVVAMSDGSIPKEMTIILRPAMQMITIYKHSDNNAGLKESSISVHWLTQIRKDAQERSKAHRFGIFGTSIAGTWLFSELDGRVDFFVDEDRSRVGKDYLGCPVFHPEELSRNMTVYIPLPHEISIGVKRRLVKKYSDVIWISALHQKNIAGCE